MYKVTKIIRFCYGHRLINYSGKCKHLHGHNGKAEIELCSNKLDNKGMVRDFEDIKKTVQLWINETLDHTLILHRNDPLVKLLMGKGERVFIIDSNPTAEAIAKLIFNQTKHLKLPVTSVKLWETDNSFATYSEPLPSKPTHSKRR